MALTQEQVTLISVAAFGVAPGEIHSQYFLDSDVAGKFFIGGTDKQIHEVLGLKEPLTGTAAVAAVLEHEYNYLVITHGLEKVSDAEFVKNIAKNLGAELGAENSKTLAVDLASGMPRYEALVKFAEAEAEKAGGIENVAGIITAQESDQTIESVAKDLVDNGTPIEPSVPGKTISLTDGRDTEDGQADANNKFVGDVGQNQDGALANALSTGDRLDGIGGRNTLEATLIQDQVTQDGFDAAVRPITKNIQEVRIEALDTTGNNVQLNATRMENVEQFWSDFSDTNLTISNVNLRGDNLSITKDVTFGLKDVVAGAGLEVLFESPALTREGPGRQDSAMRLNLLDMGTQESPYDANAPLGQLPVNGFAFSIDGVRKEIRSEDILDAKTYAELLVAVQTAIAAAAETDESLQGLSVVRDQNGFTTAPQVVLLPNGSTRTQVGDSIVITDSQGRTLEGISYIQEGDTTGFTLFGRFGADKAVETTNLIESNLILDNAGRGSLAGDVNIVGGSPSNKGVEKINLMVDRDSAIDFLESTHIATGTRHLDQIEVTSLENNGTLRIANLDDVQVFNAAAFEGTSLTLDNVAINSAEGHTYTSAGATRDVMNFRVDQEAAASSQFGLDIVTGGGNDVVNVSFDDVNATGSVNNATLAEDQITQSYGAGTGIFSNGNGTTSQWANLLQLEATNTKISALGGDNDITTYGFGVANVRTGGGEDAIKTDNSGDKASFVVNGAKGLSAPQLIGDTNISTSIVGDGNTSYNLFNTKVQVKFMGVTSDYELIDSSDYRTTARQINEAIKKAIANDAHLSKILAVEDVRDEGLVLRSLVDRQLTSTDLTFNFLAPRKADGTNAVNATFDQFRAQEVVTDQELQSAWETYFNSTWGGSSGGAITTETQMLTQINTAVTGLGTGSYAVNAGDVITDGGNSVAWTHNTVNAGAGNDTIVLSTNQQGGFDTVVFEDNFGHNVILNFNTSNVGANRADQLDFTDYLDPAANARGSSANTGTNTYTDGLHAYRLITQGTASWNANTFANTATVDTANAVGAHNSVNFVSLSQLWNAIPAAQRPESFFDLTEAQLKVAVDALYAGTTVNARADGMQSVLVVIQDQNIAHDGAGNPILAGAAVNTDAIVFTLNMNVSGAAAGNATFTVDRRGSIELENAFSNFNTITDVSIAGTKNAVDAEEAVKAGGEPTDPTEPTVPTDPNFVTVKPVDSVAVATDAADAITFTNLETGQFTITGFNAAEDKLVLTGLTGADGATLAELAGDAIDSGVIGVQVNEIAGSTFVNLGLDADSAVISIELAGVTDPALVNVDLA